jgi:sRNA-binding protein
MNRRLTSYVIFSGMLLAGFSIGCNKQSSPAPTAASNPAAAPAPAPPSDAEISRQVQAQLQADSALPPNAITANAANGIVTLSGSVPDAAARELAGNDAAQVSGVRTVVNNLTVAAPAAAASDANARAAERARQQREEARLKQQQREKARREQQQAAQAAATRQAAQQQQAAPAAQQQANNTPPSSPPPPPPPPQPVKKTVVIPAGSDIAVRTTETLETGKVQSNDTFHGVLVDSLVVNGVTAIRRGSDVTGVVLDAKDATHFKGRAQLSLGLQQIKADGRTLNVSTEPLLQQGAARGKNTAEKAGGGALLGTLIGALAGGGKGALIGAAAGAGTGAGVNAITRGAQVKIPSESVLHFVLNQPLTVTVTVMPGSNDGNPGSGRWGTQGSGQPQLQQPNDAQPQDQGPPQ